MKIHRIFRENREIQKGLTLLEILIASSMGAFLMTSLAVATGVFLDSYSTGLDDQDLTLAHHLAMERILRAVNMASEADMESVHEMTLTFPDGGTERFSWSGTQGDSLLIEKDGGPAYPLVDGVDSLNFNGNMVDVQQDEFETEHAGLLSFDLYGGYNETREDRLISEGCIEGVTFRIPYEEAVEKIELTSMKIRLGKENAQHWAHLKISLLEGITEYYPRPWGDDLAEVLVMTFDIPPVSYPNGQREVDWFTVDLTDEGFIILPNRFYTMLFQSSNGQGQVGFLRLSKVNQGHGPLNNMTWMGSTDGGSTWDPPTSGQTYKDRDVPLVLEGDVFNVVTNSVPRVGSIDVGFGLSLGESEEYGTGKAWLRGGGDL